MLLAPIPPDRRPERFARLLGGLVLYGVSGAVLVLAGFGLDSWNVLHQGLSRTFGLGVGTWLIIVGFVVLLGWIPLRQRPGIGTVLNVVVIGLVMDLVLGHASAPTGLTARIVMLVMGVAFNGIATGLYIGAGLGPGPRDGLMTGIAARGHSLRVVRTGIELTALGLGWLLGGTVGVGTLVYALSIGFLVHRTVPWLAMDSASGHGGPGRAVPRLAARDEPVAPRTAPPTRRTLRTVSREAWRDTNHLSDQARMMQAPWRFQGPLRWFGHGRYSRLDGSYVPDRPDRDAAA
jgi:uncharacterized membrane protein YczE